MCQVLEVSKSGYYRYCQYQLNAQEQHDKQLLAVIKDIHRESRGLYGSPRIYAELKAQKIECGKHKVARLMKENKLQGKAHRRQKWNPCVHYDYPIGQDHLKRQFNWTAPNRAWVSDITYIPTQEGWLYLLVILDLFSRKVIGYGLSDRMDKDLAIEAFEGSVQLRNPPEGLIFHSDRGMQYISGSFQHRIKLHGAISSFSRKGNCWDNAVAESFFHTLKTELTRGQKYQTRAEARRQVFEYIFGYYNNKRRHSHLNYKTPAEFEKGFAKD